VFIRAQAAESADDSGADDQSSSAKELPSALFTPDTGVGGPHECLAGAYRLNDGTVVDIGVTSGDGLRWRRVDGTTGALTKSPAGTWNSTLGWTERPDGKSVSFSECSQGDIRFDGIEGHRMSFDTTDTTFDRGGIKLAGRLIMPEGDDAVPIVVLLHGAEADSAVRFNSLQRRLPAAGVGAFVYDKRGTGSSAGEYTQDFQMLARDAVAAMHEARRLAGERAGRIGYQGPSQGGWVAPLAAQLSPVDFVIVTFGLAVSVAQEDREAMAMNMEAAGYGSDILAKALELSDAAAALIASGMTQGFERFETLRREYQDEPWFKHARGNFTHVLLSLSPAELREKREMFVLGTPMYYDPMPAIAALRTPQLWILAQDDIDAPSAETARRLQKLRASGHPITTAMFPRTEHGIFEYEAQADGSRLSTRQPQGYFELMLDFAREGRVSGAYGSALVSVAKESNIPP
jgi:pimeloyl-ACP methyl ester carboxylesterase